MASLTKRLRVYSDGSLEVYPQLWRVKHDTTPWRTGLPEVFPLEPNHFTPMTREIQLLSKSINPLMTNAKWRQVYTWQRAFTNQQGFERPGDPRRDYVNRLNLNAQELPRQESLVCGGTILAERFVQGEYLYCDYLDGKKPMPTATYVLARPWLWFDAVNVDKDANGKIVIRRFPQGLPDRTHVLLLASRPVRIHLSKVTRLPYGGAIPSPYQVP